MGVPPRPKGGRRERQERSREEDAFQFLVYFFSSASPASSPRHSPPLMKGSSSSSSLFSRRALQKGGDKGRNRKWAKFEPSLSSFWPPPRFPTQANEERDPKQQDKKLCFPSPPSFPWRATFLPSPDFCSKGRRKT